MGVILFKVCQVNILTQCGVKLYVTQNETTNKSSKIRHAKLSEMDLYELVLPIWQLHTFGTLLLRDTIYVGVGKVWDETYVCGGERKSQFIDPDATYKNRGNSSQ